MKKALIFLSACLFFILLLFGVLGSVSQHLFSNVALASNSYISNETLTTDSCGNLILTFHTDTTFIINIWDYGTKLSYWWVKTPPERWNSDWVRIYPVNGGAYNDYTYTAGNTYSVYLYSSVLINDACDVNAGRFNINADKFSAVNIDWTQEVYIYGIQSQSTPWSDNSYHLDLALTPSLTLTYPEADAEINGPFEITGTITQPSPYEYNYVSAKFYWYDPNDPTNEFNFVQAYVEDLTASSSQAFSISITNLPISNPRYLGVSISLLKPGGSYYSTGYPWVFKLKTMAEVGQWPPGPPPSGSEIFLNDGLIQIWSPSPASDGLYYLSTPTSTIQFMLYGSLSPDDLIVISEVVNGQTLTKLSTRPLSEVVGAGYFETLAHALFPTNGYFTVDNFDVSTSTSYEVSAYIYDASMNELVENHWWVQGTEGAQAKGIWGAIDTFISAQLVKVFSISENTRQLWFGIADILKQKVPMVYFYEIKDIFDNASLEDSAVLPAFAIHVPGESASSTISVNMFDTSQFESTGGTSAIRTGLRTIIGYALWVGFMIWLFHLGVDQMPVHNEHSE